MLCRSIHTQTSNWRTQFECIKILMMSAISFLVFSFRYSLNNHIFSVANAVSFVFHQNCMHFRFGRSMQLGKRRKGNWRCLNKISLPDQLFLCEEFFLPCPSHEIRSSFSRTAIIVQQNMKKNDGNFCHLQNSDASPIGRILYSRFCLVIAVPIQIINRHFIHKHTQQRVQKRTNKQLQTHKKLHQTEQRTYVQNGE